MQRAVATANDRRPEFQLSMRIGLSAGETVCEKGDYFGAPVVEARRLCDAADPGQIAVADVVRLLGGSRAMPQLEPVGELSLKGLPTPTLVWQVAWHIEEGFALRVAIADDSVLLREGITRVLEAEGIEVVLQVSDGESLLRALAGVRPM
jgi:hypothetical protein